MSTWTEGKKKRVGGLNRMYIIKYLRKVDERMLNYVWTRHGLHK